MCVCVCVKVPVKKTVFNALHLKGRWEFLHIFDMFQYEGDAHSSMK